MFATMFKLKFVCLCVHVSVQMSVQSKLFSEGDVACRKLGLSRVGVFNISKVSSRDIQRHKRVTGDADSSVNSAGG